MRSRTEPHQPCPAPTAKYWAPTREQVHTAQPAPPAQGPPSRRRTWPEGRLADEAPGEARLVQELVKRLKAAMKDRGLEEIEELSNVNKSSISRLLRGETWGTLPVIDGLERALDKDLWGDEHR